MTVTEDNWPLLAVTTEAKEYLICLFISAGVKFSTDGQGEVLQVKSKSKAEVLCSCFLLQLNFWASFLSVE